MGLIPVFLADPVGLLASPLFNLLLVIVITPLIARYLNPDNMDPSVINRRPWRGIPFVLQGADHRQSQARRAPEAVVSA